MRVRVALAASGLVLVLGTSCDGGDPTPTTLPTPPSTTLPTPTSEPPSPTASPSPTPAAPTLPTAARADTPTGAQAFARHWLATLDYAYKTGDTKPFRALGTCEGCTALAANIDKVYREGGSVTGGSLSTVETRLERHVPTKAAAVELYYSRTQRVVVDGKGKRFTDAAAGRLGFLLVLERRVQEWQVIQFPVIER